MMNDNYEIDREDAGYSAKQTTESILKEVLSLKQSIDKLSERLENIETTSLAELTERMDILTELSRGNNEFLELLRSESNAMLQEVNDSVNRTGADLAESITDTGKPIEEYRNWIKDELEDATGRMVEASTILETTLCDAMKSLETSLNDVSREESESIIEVVNDISGNMEVLSIEIDSKITDSKNETSGILTEAFEEVSGRSLEQIKRLSEISELLTLHKRQVEDNELHELNRRAISYFNAGDFKQAHSLLEEALQMSPESPEILSNLAHVEVALGNLETGEQIFRKILEINPDFDVALSGLGTILITSDRADETIEFLEKLFKDDKLGSPDTTLVFARALTAVDRHKDAVSLLQKARELAPGHSGIERALQEYGVDI